MELRQLEYLVAVIEEGGFTRGAERVGVAQPGVSAQVRRLERELGEELVDRSDRGARPTAAGEAVLPWARAALAGAAGVRLALQELTGLLRGRVAVGVATAHSGFDVPGLLAAFRRDHPEVGITLTQGPSRDLLAAVADGSLDLAVAGSTGPPPAGVGVATVLDEELVAAVPPGDALARRRSVTLAALDGRDLICLPAGTGIRAALDGALAAAGLSRPVALEAGEPGVVADLAADGLGVAVLPASLVASRGHLRAVPLSPPLRGRLELAWREGAPGSPAARELVRRARAVLPGPPDGG